MRKKYKARQLSVFDGNVVRNSWEKKVHEMIVLKERK